MQALNQYYEILSSDEDSGIAPFGYSVTNVSYAVVLSLDGELIDLYPLFQKEQRGRNMVEVPQRKIVPEQKIRTSGVSANFLCDNCAYVLGVSDKEAKDPGYAIKRFESFRDWNKELLSKANCDEAQAVMAFLNSYDPSKSREHSVIGEKLEEILNSKGNIIFRLEGQQKYVHQNPEIKRVWEAYKNESGEAQLGQCLVTGEIAPIARLHPSLKNIVGAKPSGATLVGFNASAYESYNRARGQGLNSPVSEKAAFAYTTALNHLLANENTRIKLGDTTVVYWAESADQTYSRIFSNLFDPSLMNDVENGSSEMKTRDIKGEQRLGEIAQKIKRTQMLDTDNLLEDVNSETRFYVLGLSPNAARVSVRFFYMDPFRKTIEKIVAHYKDLAIEKEFDDQPTWIPFRLLLKETVSKKASNPQVPPLLAGSMLRAIFSNSPYPAALYSAVINRIRADMDDSTKGIKKINYVRAAIIKAYLTRKYRNHSENPFQEVLIMGLNEQSTNQAYLLGRLFAVLEKTQQDAIGQANASIKDRYFTSACATPGSVFPVLLRLSQHHIAKAEYGYVNDKRIETIMNLLDVDNDPIPAHLSLDEQGIFVLGYYHQRADFYKPRAGKPDKQDQEYNNSQK